MPTGFTGALTLAQYAEQSNDPLINAVTFSILESDSILSDIPLYTKQTQKINGARFTGNLPAVNWRPFNSGVTVTSGTASPYSEQMFLASNAFDIDDKILRDVNAVGNPAFVQVQAWLKSLSYDLMDKCINNTHESGDANAPVGIRKRIDDSTTWGTNTACKIDAGTVDISVANITAANMGKVIYYLDQALDELGSPEGEGCAIYMNRQMRRLFNMGIKMMGAGGGFDMTQDAYGRRVMTYRNANIRTVGLKADQSTEIITNTETTAGVNGASNQSSLYVIKYGDGYFTGWQFDPLAPIYNDYRSDEPNMFRIAFDWGIGLNQSHTRCIARVYDIKVK
jgi:hypothetical protein